MRNFMYVMAAMVCGATWAMPAGAVTYAEVGDTGDLPAGAQNVGLGVDTITGDISFGGDVDMYQLLLAAGTYTFETRNSFSGGGTLHDPNLFLFNALGNPLAGNDDGASGNPGIPGGDLLDSAFTLNLTAGI